LARFRVKVKLGLVLGFELELGQVIVIVLAFLHFILSLLLIQ